MEGALLLFAAQLDVASVPGHPLAFGMSNPNSGNLPAPTLPDVGADLPVTLDPAVEELWSSRALLIVRRTFLAAPGGLCLRSGLSQ